MKRFAISLLLILLIASRSLAAVVYLRSTDGSDSDNGSTWALAKATLASALTAAGAGGTVYVSDNHAETQASVMTLTSPGTVRIICVDDAGDPQPPTARATTATVSTTGANNLRFGNGGVDYYYGLTFTAGDTTNNASITNNTGTMYATFEQCRFELTNSNASATIDLTYYGAVICNNCVFKFGATGQKITGHTQYTFVGCSVDSGGTIPTTLLQPTSYVTGRTTSIGCDWSALGSGKNLATSVGNHLFVNCKLGASVSYVTGSFTDKISLVQLVNCDAADTNYKYYHQHYAGTVRDETTIVKTSGSSDGTTPISYKFVTTANSKFYTPLYGPWMTFWADSTGSTTVTAEVITDGVTLTDAEAWIEVESLNNGSFPISTITTDQVADPIFGTPANQTSSSVDWTTTGLISPTKQKLAATFTTAEKGPIRARVVLAKASTTMYADALVKP